MLKNNKIMKQITHEYLVECIIGSQAYGTQTPESDI